MNICVELCGYVDAFILIGKKKRRIRFIAEFKFKSVLEILCHN